MASKSKALEEFNIKNIINYMRKSRQDEDRERKTGEDTLHEQKLLMDRVLSQYGVPYDQKPEVGSGDKIATRPVFQSIVRDIDNGKYDAIAVKEISRMGRGSYSDMGTIYDLIIEKRLFIITPFKIYDPTNPSDLRQIRFELFMSREEFETTRERLVGGRYNAAMEGKWVSGKAPFGYDYNAETKRLVINEKEAEIVRAIFDFYAYGIILEDGNRKLIQFRALGTYLKRLGIKTTRGKDEWSVGVLRYFLSSERYIGTIRFNTMRETSEGKRVRNPEKEHVVVQDAHPPIIDMKTWDRVQYRMNNRDSPTNTRLDFSPSELAGICVCKKCGKKFIRRGSVHHYEKKDGSISVYNKEMLFCGTTGCTYVKYRSIEEDILETLKYLMLLDPNTFQEQVSNIVVKEKPTKTKDDVVQYINSRHEELKRRLKFIQEKHESGIYTDEIFLERKAELDKELEDLKKVEIEDGPETESKPMNVESVKTNIQSALEAYENEEEKGIKNKILHTIFSHVNIEIVEKGSGSRPAVHRIEPFLKSRILSNKTI